MLSKKNLKSASLVNGVNANRASVRAEFRLQPQTYKKNNPDLIGIIFFIIFLQQRHAGNFIAFFFEAHEAHALRGPAGNGNGFKWQADYLAVGGHNN